MSNTPLNFKKSKDQYKIILTNKLLFNDSKLKTPVLYFNKLLGA